MKEFFTRRELLRSGAATAAGLTAGGLLLPRNIYSATETPTLTDETMYSFPSWVGTSKKMFEDPPDKLVDDAGRLRVGFFNRPVRNANIDDAAIFGEGKKRNRAMAQLKEHMGFGVVHPEVQVSFIIIDSQVMALGGLYSYDFKKKTFFEHKFAEMDKSKYHLEDNTWNDHSFIEQEGLRMEFRHHLEKGYHELEIDIDATSKAPSVKASLKVHENLETFQPFVACIPINPNHFMYNQKAHMPVEGTVIIGDRELTFDPTRDKTGMDEHKGYYPFENHYRWMAFGGYDKNGKLIGMNATENEHFREPDIWNESCLWTDRNLALIGAVHFEFDPADVTKPWHISESNDRVDLVFKPEAKKEEKHNLMFAKIHYYQQCGWFNGYIIDDAGTKHSVDNIYGVAEELTSTM